MTEQKRIKKPAEKKDEEQKLVVDKKKDEKQKTDLDKLIEEIDDVLEENAEEFVQNYIQRGGE